MTEKKVIVYSTPTCPYCNILKDFLKKKGVKFEDYNVAVDAEKAREMVQRTGQNGVPVITIDNNVVIGFLFLNEIIFICDKRNRIHNLTNKLLSVRCKSIK